MTTATILPFPAKVAMPVQNRKRRGPLPRGIVSLRKVSRQRAVARILEDQEREKIEALLARAETYLYAVFKLRRLIED